MEETVLLIRGEVVNYIEHEVIVTTEEVILITHLWSIALVGESFATYDLQTSSIVRSMPLPYRNRCGEAEAIE